MENLLLGFFSNGAASVSIPLTIVALGLVGWFLFQSFRKAAKDGGVRTTRDGGTVYDDKPNPWWKQKQSGYALAVIVLYIIVMFIVKSDYRRYDPKKDGVPNTQSDPNRIPAEDLLPKK